MKMKDYEQFVQDNAMMPIDDTAYSFIGLAGETGEVMEWYKKAVLRQDPSFTEKDLVSELGDVLHYVTRIALSMDLSLKDVMAENVSKLKKRDGLRKGRKL